LNLNSSEKSLFLESDELLLSQIIDNILSNAIKFTPPGKEVFIDLMKAGGRVIIKIKDQGPGFSENDKKVMFGKFAKLSARPTGGELSTGLGLSIVKKLVEMLDGSIKVESEEGNGAEFILVFSNTN
jgi:signal transduction histidine kinase